MIHHDDFLDMERLRNTLKVKRVNDELLEYLASSLRWVIHYCRKHDIPLPEEEKIIDLCNKAIEIERKLPKLSDGTLQVDKTRRSDDNSTEPYKWSYNVLVCLDNSTECNKSSDGLLKI